MRRPVNLACLILFFFASAGIRTLTLFLTKLLGTKPPTTLPTLLDTMSCIWTLKVVTSWSKSPRQAQENQYHKFTLVASIYFYQKYAIYIIRLLNLTCNIQSIYRNSASLWFPIGILLKHNWSHLLGYSNQQKLMQLVHYVEHWEWLDWQREYWNYSAISTISILGAGLHQTLAAAYQIFLVWIQGPMLLCTADIVCGTVC